MRRQPASAGGAKLAGRRVGAGVADDLTQAMSLNLDGGGAGFEGGFR